MVSNLLYQRRFGGYFTEPIVAGLDPVTNKPYICGMDTIGCIAQPRDFVVVGTGAEYALGVCESKLIVFFGLKVSTESRSYLACAIFIYSFIFLLSVMKSEMLQGD